MSKAGGALLWCPFGSMDDARDVARQMIEEELVACANILPEVESIFRWKGEIAQAVEVAAIFKTEAQLLDRAALRLAELHPYETPAVMGWHVSSVPPVTLDWISDQLRRQG